MRPIARSRKQPGRVRKPGQPVVVHGVPGPVGIIGTPPGVTKASNPKEAFGDAKMPMDLLPDPAVVQFNLAFLEGALKYGQYNWRVAGVKVSTYVRAMRRHLSKFWNGQDVDPSTLVHELASVGACCAIVLDAIACGKLTDDRPPRADMERALGDAAGVAKHLKQLFASYTPTQYTEQWVKWNSNTVVLDVPAGTLPVVSSREIKNRLRRVRRLIKKERDEAATKRRNPTSRKKLMAAVAKGRKPR